MKQATRLFVGALMAAFTCFGMTGVASAQDKGKDAKAAPAAKAEKGKATRKDLIDNDKVGVFEITFKAGDEGATNTIKPARVIRVLKGGTLSRAYTDGKTETVEYKTGEVKYFENDRGPNTLKNTGKTDIVLYNVFLKEPKK